MREVTLFPPGSTLGQLRTAILDDRFHSLSHVALGLRAARASYGDYARQVQTLLDRFEAEPALTNRLMDIAAMLVSRAEQLGWDDARAAVLDVFDIARQPA